jgi:DNA-binding CsgD family transcriptional regulator
LFTSEETRRVFKAQEELSYLWSTPDPFYEATRSISKLVPGTTVLLYEWAGENADRFEIIGESDPTKGMELEWLTSGLCLEHRPFNPLQPCPLANAVFHIDLMDTVNPKGYHLFRETGLDNLGFGPYGEAILYKGKKYIACFAFGRFIGDTAYSDRDLELFQTAVHNMTNALYARKLLWTSGMEPGQVMLIADAIDAPAFIATTSGIVVHANQKAVAAYPSYPAWMKVCCSERPGVKRPSWVKRVPIRLGEMSFWLLLPERLVADPEDAPMTPWARRWGLQPRHARLAALLMQGLSDKEIAERLGLEYTTVRTYVKELFVLARVHSRHELVNAALKIS